MKKIPKLLIFFIILIWYGYLFTNNNFIKVLEQKKELNKLKKELKLENVENDNLENQLKKVNDKEYIEALIRKNLNKSYKGEIIFKKTQ